MQTVNAIAHRQQLAGLLKANGLPFEDLPDDLSCFLVMIDAENVIGSVGVEQYGQYGLLRSVAVDAAYRSRGLAGKLVEAAERLATEKGMIELYLLTETAPEYFAGKGYLVTERPAIPGEVQQSSEFAHVCPQSAIAMKKILIK